MPPRKIALEAHQLVYMKFKSYFQLHIQTNMVVRIVPAKQASSHKPEIDSAGIK